MALRSKYDAQADRMLLTLESGDGVLLNYWVTRRQCLGLLHALRNTPGATASATPAPSLRRLAVCESELVPVALRGIRLRKLDDGVKLVFVTAARQGVGVDLRTAGVFQLQAMLRQQAERAGWDVAAALARLGAARLADAAVKRAKNLH